MSTLRLAVPRARFAFHSQQLQALQYRATQQRTSLLLFRRHESTSTTPPPKPRVLEQPDRFRPPSHGARLRSRPKYAGPPMSDHERQAQRTRTYPHMMPPEGTFAHWFLTDKSVHVVITLGILVTLVFGIYLQDFLSKTPYRDLLPPGSLFFNHPIRFIERWIEVFDMHIAYTSVTTAEMRKKKADDIVKRSEFRKAHGKENEGWFGGWTARENDVTADGTRLVPEDVLRNDAAIARQHEQVAAAAALAEEAKQARQQQQQEDTYVAFDGSVQPARKKWLGIF